MMKAIRNPGGGPRSPSLMLFAGIRQLPHYWSPCPPVCTFSSHHFFKSGVLHLYSNVGFSNLSTYSFRLFVHPVFHAERQSLACEILVSVCYLEGLYLSSFLCH